MLIETHGKGIPFTQHLMPDGRKVPQWIDLGPALNARADVIISKGGSFHVELLRDMQTVSLTVEHISAPEGDLVIVLVPNGPEVPGKVKDLIGMAEMALGIVPKVGEPVND